MSIFEHPEFDNHEKVLFCNDPAVGLRAIIAIHSTTLGPAAGGCRMHAYASEDAALTDVLRLSKGMSYKNAVADLPLGGGKCVIIADPARADKADLLRAFSRHVQDLGGLYWTAIDVGVGPKDADILAENCDYIFCRAEQYEEGFNPSSFTALGGFTGIRAAAKHVWDRNELTGLRVAIQGLGGTGADLARQLHAAGAELVVADVRDEVVQDVVAKYGVTAVPPDRIHAQDVDIFAPCAMGAVVNATTLPEIKAKVICGLANNQLAEPKFGRALQERGITYVPDYVVNAGGVMGGSTVIFSTPSREADVARITGLYHTILDILKRADDAHLPSSEVADDIALAKIAAARPKA
ncbi:Leu/Phe/Val dehydrogenase [Falsihalocynthiibacter arcticus]|uniref:Amino acid dehydrogenase n=1 Tax=Falsihalocynthiibacter arcticus TaxID=1579316 RepID=A0A126V1V2_9RHOB|nr:Glu/Leu/Phe/Val dehydrogenase dimerization domain-containing protein [Falsihalocynthiibacter arcticus]AML52274.1 amino acid dehydrogenase [Falsihalocynthiibacter arcticus]